MPPCAPRHQDKPLSPRLDPEFSTTASPRPIRARGQDADPHPTRGSLIGRAHEPTRYRESRTEGDDPEVVRNHRPRDPHRTRTGLGSVQVVPNQIRDQPPAMTSQGNRGQARDVIGVHYGYFCHDNTRKKGGTIPQNPRRGDRPQVGGFGR